jgi:hypothetical protein
MTYAYIPVTVTNSESTAIPTDFQQLVSVDLSPYTTFLNRDLSNTFFSSDTAGSDIITSWLESGNTYPFNSVNFWLYLPDGIGASSSITVYLQVDLSNTSHFNDTTTGVAPNLTSTYAEYDDGANVFLLYLNGNTPLTDFNVYTGVSIAQAVGVAYGSGTTNAINITGNNNDVNTLQVGYKRGTTATSIIAESNFQEYKLASTSQGEIVIANSSTTANTTNAIDVEMGFGGSYFSQAYISGGTATTSINKQGTENSTWNYASVTQIAGSTSFYGYIAPQLYSTAEGYSGTVTVNPISTATELYIGFGIASTSSGYPWNSYINWARARAYPPNGVMPSATAGTSSGFPYYNTTTYEDLL